MTRMEAKGYIDEKVTEFMLQEDATAHFSANLIDKEKWTKTECDETVAELIEFLQKRRKRRTKQ